MFRSLLSPEARLRLEQEHAEAMRLYRLPNVWLASAILMLARKAQGSTPQYEPGDCTYNARLIWGLVPELARRTGIVHLTTNEIDWTVRDISDYQLRVLLGHALANIATSKLPGWSLLAREVANGNPLVYAIDRLCPGKMGDRDDSIVRRLTEIAAIRRCPYDGIWTPEMETPWPPLIIDRGPEDEETADSPRN